MFRKELSEIVAEITRRPVTSIADALFTELQAAGVVPTGRRGKGGGVEMNATHRINVALAAALDRQYGVLVGDTVRHWRSLELRDAVALPPHPKMSRQDNMVSSFQFVEGLGLKLDDVGTALDGIVESMRTGAFEKWAAGAVVYVTADFHGDANVQLSFNRPQFNKSAFFLFGSEQAELPIEKFIRFNRAAFEKLAA